MKKMIFSAIAASVLLTGALYAESNTANNANAKAANTIAVNNAKKDAKKHEEKLVSEAIDSLKHARKALKNLEENKSDDAVKNIALALGKLEVILAAEKAPKLLPVDNIVSVNNYLGSAEDTKKAVKLVEKLLDDNKIQEARELLCTLQSEIDVTVVSLPLETYPDALKLASKYILSGNQKEAKRILELALNTFTQTHFITPIPMVHAAKMIELASDIAKKDKDKALDYLKQASDSLDKAEALGYVSDSSTTYKELHKDIKAIEKEIKGPNKAEKLFEDFGKKLKEFSSKIFSSKENSDNK